MNPNIANIANQMKKIIVSTIIAAGIALAVFNQNVSAQAQHRSVPGQHSTVIFSIGEGPGASIQVYSISKSGPAVPQLSDDAAETISRLLDAGFSMRQEGWLFTFSR